MGDFGINNFNKPIIQGAKSMQNDGGAGNLGYFEREGEKKESGDDIDSVFIENKQDAFDKEGDLDSEDEDFSIPKLIAQIILAIKDFFKSIFKPNSEDSEKVENNRDHFEHKPFGN